MVAIAASSLVWGQASCTPSIGTSVAFGAYNAASGTPAIASTTASLTCVYVSGGTQHISWDMQLSNGRSGNCNARVMQSASGSTLNYYVYQNAVGNPVWGNAGCGTYPSGQFNVGPGGGNNSRTVTSTLAGQLPAGQFGAGAGTYTDTLTLTINWN